MQMRGLDKILLLPKFQTPNLPYLILPPLNNPLIRLHGPNPSHLLISLDPLLLKLLNGLLKFNPNSFIAFGQLDDPGQAVFGFYSQAAQTVVQGVQLGIVGDVRVGNLDLLVLVLVQGDQAAALTLPLHLLEDLDQVFQLLLQFLAVCPAQRWQLLQSFWGLFRLYCYMLALRFYGTR